MKLETTRWKKGALIIAAAMAVTGPAVAQVDQDRMLDQQQQQQQMQSGQEQQRQQPGQPGEPGYERGRMGETDRPMLTEDSKAEISAVLSDALEAAVSGDIDDLIDNFAEADRERLSAQSDSQFAATLSARADNFEQKWNDQFDTDFDDGLNNTVINTQMTQGVADESAIVSIRAANNETVQLRMVDEGVLKTTWRIDVPDTLTRSQLAQKLGDTLSELHSGALPVSSSDSYSQVAVKVFKNLSQPS